MRSVISHIHSSKIWHYPHTTPHTCVMPILPTEHASNCSSLARTRHATPQDLQYNSIALMTSLFYACLKRASKAGEFVSKWLPTSIHLLPSSAAIIPFKGCVRLSSCRSFCSRNACLLDQELCNLHRVESSSLLDLIPTHKQVKTLVV